ncbi:hypothetical protein ACFQPG_09195 [Sphingomonas sp. GCM10030256]|uniref:hypothetical protein n=1 Tax=Sphingomonas sp. GCM10030256 TaxID=3273427 RepID=UPI00362255F8
MRKLIVLGALLAAGCQQQEPKQAAEDLRTMDVQSAPPAYPGSSPVPGAPPPPPPPPVSPPPLVSSNASASDRAMSADLAGGPEISVTAAPGVAFNYRYAFRLPNARIQPIQEAHAAMCEKLGITRCRINGMRYSLVNERDISASLEMKLDPAIAREFGRQASKTVVDAQGMLVDQQITGIDAGSSIERANRSRAELQDELDRVNRELSRSGLSSVVRDRLLSEAQSLRAQIRALGEQKRTDEESLATTPMAFYYGSGRIVPGFEEPTPLADALDRAGYNFKAAVGFLIVAAATLLPWLLLIGLAWLLARRLGLFRTVRTTSYRTDAEQSGELREPGA